MAGTASDLEAPDFDPDRNPDFAPGIQGRVRVAPDIPGHLMRRTVEVSGTSPGHRSEGSAQSMNDIHQSFAQQGLVRPSEGRVLGGVCAGLGRRFGIDPWPARLLFVLLLLVVPGSQLLIYPILWILMPRETSYVAPSAPAAAPAG